MTTERELTQALRQSLLKIQHLKQTLQAAESASSQPIAIVGMSCRAPGGSTSPESYWSLLESGGDGVGPLPGRWSRELLRRLDVATGGLAQQGGFVDAVEDFDAAFFGISPREALEMDPQQRLILEAVWEALERAGIRPEGLRESRTGVYLGSMAGDYGTRSPDSVTMWTATGTTSSVLAGRVSYVLGLEGPAMTVDTACSSSLTTLHLACVALRQGECDLALAGGVTVMSTPATFVALGPDNGMAPDGRCKSFSDGADGAGWSEGCGVLVLKRQSDAERDGDEILALIRGSAVNQDGRSQGLTVPNGPSQQRVIRAALSASGVSPDDIDVVEAHGTGTSLGDPIEAGALAAVFGPTRSAERPLWLGSSKSNLGHTQAAAGVLGVIKMVLSLQHEFLPKTLHAQTPSSHIVWEGSGLSLLQEPRAWPRDASRVRRAGVSSFGLSGTNAHVVLEEAPARQVGAAPGAGGRLPLLISGRDEAALRAQAGRYAGWLPKHPEADWSDVVTTAALHRTHFAARASVSARDAAEAVEVLRALGEGRLHPAVSLGEAKSERDGKLAFLFTGQGAQQLGMGRALLESCSAFRTAFEEICGHFDELLEIPLRSVLFAEEGSEAAAKLDQTAYAQPALFAVEIALFRQLEQWGVEPDILLGHSIGELAAAHVSGVWSLKDACRVVAARGRLMQALPAGGAMVALEASEAEILPLLEDGVEIAGLNGPRSTVISGDEAAVLALAARFKGMDRRTNRLQVSHAFHSRRMEPMLDEFSKALSSVTCGTPKLPIVSNVTGRLATREELCSAEYWVRQVRSPVRFLDGVQLLEAQGMRASLELGPDGVLTALAAGCLSDASQVQVVATQRRGRDGTEALLAALGALHVHGVAVDWAKALGPNGSKRIVALPTYAFQRQRYWLEAETAIGDAATMGLSPANHPLLAAATPLADDDGFLLTGRLSATEPGWLRDQTIFGTALLPGTGLLELGFAAARAVGLTTVSQLTLATPLVLPPERAVRLQVQVDAPGAGDDERRTLSIYSRLEAASEDAPWRLHAQGLLSGSEATSAPTAETGLEAWPPAGGTSIDLSEFYSTLQAQGYDCGPSFRGLREAWRVGEAVYGRAVLPEELSSSAQEYGLHPALLDAALHVLSLAQLDGAEGSLLLLPFEWLEASLVASGARELRVRASMERRGDGETLARLQLADGSGQAVLRVGGLRLRDASEAQIRDAARSEAQHLYRLDWRPVVLSEAGPEALTLIVGGDGKLAKRLGLDRVDSVAALVTRLDEGGSIPDRVVFDHLAGPVSGEDGLLDATHADAERALLDLQGILGEARLNDAAVVWLTNGAVATKPEDGASGLSRAPLWGLVRSARAEHPDRRLQLVDVDVPPAEAGLLARLFATIAEPELALRQDLVAAPRLVRAGSEIGEPRRLDADGTVLITGGTGELGRDVARHLVDRHGVRHLLLTSRRGMETPGATELVAELQALGAQTVQVVSCDVSDRDALRAVLGGIASDRPLTGVFHLAATLDDGILPALTRERLQHVLRPKVDGAYHLHELTADQDLAAFVLFSSAAGLGGAGQANYAAANVFLDALAAERRRRGLAAQSLAWGLWEPRGTGTTARLGKAELMRMRRQGVQTLSLELGLELMDAALSRPEAGLIPLHLDLAVLQRRLEEDVPAVYRALLRAGLRRASAGSADTNALRAQLASLASDAERLRALTELVQQDIAAVLALPGASSVPADVPLKELGLDSLMAVELRNRLSGRVGTKLPTTMAFDYPTARAMAQMLLEKLELGQGVARLARRHSVDASTAASEAIAIVGMSCRAPASASPESYWSLLQSGGDGIGPLPSRWSRELLRRLEAATGSLAQEGGFVDAVEEFDARFFGISPREALEMDPQQRLMLEAVWEALERAGTRPDTLSGSRTGVYVGSTGSDYGARSLEAMTMWTATGMLSSVLAGRLAYVLGLEGPAMTVDTACSSSLTAMHLACQGLRQGECDLALAGGVTVMSTPATMVALGPDNGMASDGRCKSFSDSADGAGWSEGCGVVVLKRQSDAERDGDQILALIRGSAVNQDGRSQGLTAPNGPSQQRVIRAALAASGLEPRDIDAVEAHGTGTSLGDPIEAGALAAVFGPTRSDEQPLWLGSSKSNLGHTQAAAGVLGVIKMVLALQHEFLPRTLHAQTPSSHITWEGSGLSLLQQARPWPRDALRVRRAGVSSFGISGTNAHVVLEEAPARETIAADDRLPLPLLVSGRDDAVLRAQAGRYADWLSTRANVDWSDVVSTAALHRTHFVARASVMARDASEAVEALRALGEGRLHPAMSLGEAKSERGGKLAFLFTGQGAQQLGMGRALLESCSAFRAAFEEVCGHLDELLDVPLRSALFAEEGSETAARLDQTAYAQPALFAVEVALFRQLEQWGIAPDILLGHSIGELAAAHVAGVWSLKDACRVVAARGRLMQALPAGGAMVALEASEAEVLPLLEEGVEIAGLNGPRSTVISGDEAAVIELAEKFKRKDRRTSRLQVSHAFHSRRMEPMLDEFRKVLLSVSYGTPQLPIVSNVTGRLATGEELCSADYWVRQVRNPVRFLDGVQLMEAEGVRASLELGPDGVLTALAAGCLADASQMQVVPTQRRGRDGTEALLAALGALHVHGVAVEWEKVLGANGGKQVVALPTYAFQRQRYWLEAEKASGDVATMGLSSAEHPLLGAATPLADGDGFLLTGRLSATAPGWLKDHAIFGTVLLPGTGLLELGFAAARATGATTVSQLTLVAPLVLPEDGAVRLQVQVDAPGVGEEGQRELSIYSRSETAAEGTPWTLHAQGALGSAQDAAADAPTLEIWPPAGGQRIDLGEFYATLRARGYDYGPSFQGLREAWRVGAAVYGRAVLSEELSSSAEGYGLHPALLDAALHALTLARVDGVSDGLVLLPFEWSEVTVLASGARELRVRASVERGAAGEASAQLQLADGRGQAVAQIERLRLREASEAQIREAARSEAQHLYRVDWRAVASSETRADVPTLIVGGDGELAKRLGLEHLDSVAVVAARLDEGASVPARIVFDHLSQPCESILAATHADAARGLSELQGILSDTRLNETSVAWLTSGAVTTSPEEGASGLSRAPLWGLVRSARTEHPDRRLQLVDVDAPPTDGAQLAKLLATDAEPELALRHGGVLVPRLARAGAGAVEPRRLAASGTVLITGGSGELGRELARHLVQRHGVRHLLLTSRRGLETPGAVELVAQLQALGAQTVQVVSCDISDRDAVRAVLASIASDRPLTGVFHLAATLDDGIVPALTAERLERVFGPKVDGACHLHELTADQDLAAFVLFSAAAGFGSPGQANYAAANVFLDALAAERRHRGLAAQSLVWGLWEPRGTGMTAHLGRAELMRMRRQGVLPLSLELGLQLLDTAMSLPEVVVIPVHLDLGVLQRQLGEDVPALYRGLLRGGLKRASTSSADTNALRVRLASLASEAERLKALVQLAQEDIAAVLALPGASSVPADVPLKELGLDSLMAVELRNRLSGRVGTKLPTTAAFDYPTARAMARLLLEKLELGAVRAVRRRTVDASTAASEAIAIVGMSCRTPGGTTSPESYWSLLEGGGDGVGPLPSRWNRDLLRRLEVATGGLTHEGGFLDAVEDFDAAFYGISPREALEMDPQQRLILEAVWEALERAGIRPEGLRETRTGVYLGSMGSDYGLRSIESVTMWTTTGTLSSVLAGRVSYVLGLEGPAMTVDTACSSSLSALHLACTALRQDECDLVLTGGVQVMCTPAALVGMGADTLAPDGRCKSFADSADGPGWSEGCGVLVLKRQSDAERDGDEILALIRGSAVNQDGRSQGLTAPNGPSQQRVIRAALSASGLEPDDIDAVEAHGTGTTLGDPIEAGGLAAVFGPTRSDERPLWLGSSKSNIGHAQAAAGVLGVIKMVLSLQHELLPKTLHAQTPSSHIAWEGSGLSLLQEARAWPRDASRVRRAGVSSFGISGTNAHVVLEEAPARDGAAIAEVATAPPPLLVSGRDQAALRAQAGRYVDWLSAHADVNWADVVSTAALHRTHFAARASVSARDAAQAVEALQALGEGRAHTAVSVGDARDRGRVVFVFPGQGSQWTAMGRTLLEESAVFAETIAACETALSQYTDWSLTAVLRGDETIEASMLERVDVIQPALFAMNLGLAAVWRSFGLEPSAVVGHSQGEIAAAVVAGILSLEEGARVVALRSRLLRSLSGRGAMAVTELAAAAVEEQLKAAEWSDLSVAVVNTPGSTVVSGSSEAVERWVHRLGEEGVFCRRVSVDYASHSAEMDPILPELERLLSDLSPQAGHVPMVSTVTGTRCEGTSLDGAYWCRNLRQTVRLDRALAELINDGHGVFVEVSAHPVLAMPLSAASGEGIVVGSLRRDDGGMSELLRNLGVLHVHGVAVDWTKAFGASACKQLVALPTYAFQRQRYWLEAEKASGDVVAMGLSPANHPLLGAATPLADGDGFLLTGRLSAAEPGWLGDHAVFGTVLLPGTGLLELCFAAARAVGLTTVSQLTLAAPLVLPRDGAVRVQVQVDAPEDGCRELSIYGRLDDEGSAWTLHAQGALSGAEATSATPQETGFEAWPPAGGTSIDLTEFYATLQARGYDYGPAFQGLRQAWRVGEVVYGHAALPETLSETAESFGLHPALLDAALHALALAAAREVGVSDGLVLLPFEWSEVSLLAGGARELRVRVSVERDVAGEALAQLQLADGNGQVVARVGGLRLREASEAQIREAARSEVQHLYRLDWRAVGLGIAGPEAPTLIVGGDGELARRLGLERVDSVAALVARLDEGADAPARIVFDHLPEPDESMLAATHANARRALLELQVILSDARLNDTAAAWLTSRSVATGPEEEVSGLSRAPLWGLVRSARAEHPDRRLQLLDVDAPSVEADVLTKLLSTQAEPELALRNDLVVAPRLARAETGAAVTAGEPRRLDPAGTVLITGGVGELGRELARHLVDRRGVRHLLLTSRRGLQTPGAPELVATLQALGAETVQVVSCDVSDRASVHTVLSGIPAERRLTGVFHLAGMLDDGIVPALTGERLERVLRPKVDGACHLHELTADQDLAAFVLFSSAAGLGGAGQANYAAANVFLDALAAERRRQGLAGMSLMWGFWEQRGVGMTAHLGRAELMRMRRLGVLPLSLELGLALLDAALARPEAVLIPLHLDLAVMQRQFGDADVPALYRGLLRSGLKRASASRADTNALHARLASLASEEERLRALMQLAQEDIAAVLALPGASSVPADVPLKELGLDSLMAVQLRNRLSGRVGAKLPTTVAFDYPTARAMAQMLLEKLSLSERAISRQGTATAAATSKTDLLRSIEAVLRSADPEFLRQLDLERRLSGLADMGALEESDSSCIVPIRPGFGNRVMIYIPGLAHGATRGNTPPVITQLAGDYPIAGLNPYPLAARGLLSGSVADLASSYLPHVESWIGERSVFFVGSSFGGLVGMALASELERRGRHVAGVVLLDTLTPNYGTLPLPLEALKEMACAYLMKLYGLTEHEGDKLAELTGAPSLSALREMIGDNYRCHTGWTLPVLAAPVHLLHAEEFVETPGLHPEDHALLDLGWSRFGLELASVVMVPGNHTSMYTHPQMPRHIEALFELDRLDCSPAPDAGNGAADGNGALRGAAASINDRYPYAEGGLADASSAADS